MQSSILFTLLAAGTTSVAYTIPANLQAIYNAHKVWIALQIRRLTDQMRQPLTLMY
jgi:hypothetical protein